MARSSSFSLKSVQSPQYKWPSPQVQEALWYFALHSSCITEQTLFSPSHILVPGHLWEELTQKSLNSATSAPKTFYWIPWISESNRLPKSRSSSHQTHSLPGDSLQSWSGKWALQFLTIECSLCCISWGPHIWPSQSETAAEERGKFTETMLEVHLEERQLG